MAFQYSPKITTESLGVYLDVANRYSYSGSGADWYDLAKTGASGSLTAGFAYDSASRSFYAATATSSTAAWIAITPTISFADLSPYSLEFVVKLRPDAATTYHSLCGNGQTNPWVGIYGNTASWNMFFRESTSGTYSNSATVTNYNLASKWATVCITLDIYRTVRFYLNGSLLSTATTFSNVLNISRLAGGYSSGVNSHPFQGYFSTCRIYRKTLTDVEVLRNYLALSSRFGI